MHWDHQEREGGLGLFPLSAVKNIGTELAEACVQSKSAMQRSSENHRESAQQCPKHADVLMRKKR